MRISKIDVEVMRGGIYKIIKFTYHYTSLAFSTRKKGTKWRVSSDELAMK